MQNFSFESQKKIAMQWKNAAPVLRAQRHHDIRREKNADSIKAFDSFFRDYIRKNRPAKTSGFVQMHQILSRQRQD